MSKECEGCKALRYFSFKSECKYTPLKMEMICNCICLTCLLKYMCNELCPSFVIDAKSLGMDRFSSYLEVGVKKDSRHPEIQSFFRKTYFTKKR